MRSSATVKQPQTPDSVGYVTLPALATTSRSSTLPSFSRGQALASHGRSAGYVTPAVCSYMTCPAPATASVLVGATRRPVCFTHEREYSDRYGPADIRPLAGGYGE